MPKKKKKQVLKVGVFSDPAGTVFFGTVEEEFERTVGHLSETFPEVEVKAYLEMSFHGELVEPGTGLIVFDYGGMSYGNSLAEDNSSRLIQYAIDNPGVLCLVNSSFTWHQVVKYILAELGDGCPDNLRVMEYSDEMDALIRRWCIDVPVK